MKPFDLALQHITEKESHLKLQRMEREKELAELKVRMENFPSVLHSMIKEDARIGYYLSTAEAFLSACKDGQALILASLRIPTRVFSRMSEREVDSTTNYLVVLDRGGNVEKLRIITWDFGSRGIEVSDEAPDSNPEVLRLVRRLVNPETMLEVLFENRKPVVELPVSNS